MLHTRTEISIPLKNLPQVSLCIYGNKIDTLKEADPETALERGESPWQLLEGCFYGYYFLNNGRDCKDYQIRENTVVKNSLRKDVSEGRISPNIYVGSLELDVYDEQTGETIETVFVEVLPTKLDSGLNRHEDKGYLENYEYMLGQIAEKCTELLLQIESPVYQNFETDFNTDPKTIYQRFAFIKSMLNSEEFHESVQKVIFSPTSKWAVKTEYTDVLRTRRTNSRTIRQLMNGSNRIKLDPCIGKLKSVPAKIESYRKIETYDTHENRFVKHALNTFLQFIRECEAAFGKNKYKKSQKEAAALAGLLDNHLHHPFFTDISRPVSLKLNSPALQRKSGYRQILNSWLKFDLSVRLIWKGGDDVYKAGKRDIAVLYEYWLFFVLYDLMNSKFSLSGILHEDKNTNELKRYNHLIEETKDGLHLILRSGAYTALNGVYESGGWLFNVRFNYNKTFKVSNYDKKKEGSWTKPLRPDYTLSIWPAELKDCEAERLESIVHIHFDAKYKVQHFKIPRDEEEAAEHDHAGDKAIHDSLDDEKSDELKGIYKNADLMKMHAYNDAIRRTGGAYIIYPGTEQKTILRGFHEIIPGLGAFAIRPGNSNNGENKDSGVAALSNFIDDIIRNFKNSASQQKKYARKTFETFENMPSTLEDPLPYNLIPDETIVLVGYFKSQEHLEWIKKTKLYNFRTNLVKDALVMNKDIVNAKYLLVHTGGDKSSGKMFEIVSGPRVTSMQTLERIHYPSEPTQERYLVIKIKEADKTLFKDSAWDFRKLANYRAGDFKGFPFSTSLTELMRNKVRINHND